MAGNGYRGIIGHEDEIRNLKNSVLNDRVSHAYLFTGEEGSGKRTLADAFAMHLVCQKHEDDACLTCSACKKAMDRNHPDILYVTHEKPNLISVKEIREQVVDTVDILPYEGGRKIYIIAEAEKMNPQAQNALLKTIEEPPEYAVLLLLTTSPEALLPTIRSRCMTLALKPVPDEEVSRYLEEKLKVPDYEARILTAFAQGNIGRAKAAATEEEFSEIEGQTVRLVRRLPEMDTAGISEVVRQMKDHKDQIGDDLDMLLLWFRDVLLFKATADADHLIFQEEIGTIRDQAAGSSYEGLQEILDAIDKCRVRLNANVNFDLAVELLMLTIKENCNA